MNEAQTVRGYLETAKGPVSVRTIEKETGVEYRSGPYPELTRNGVIREWWSLAPDVKPEGLSENILKALGEKPKRLEQITLEAGFKLPREKDVHYELTGFLDRDEAALYFDLSPKSDCAICFNRAYCEKQKREYSTPIDPAKCNAFISN